MWDIWLWENVTPYLLVVGVIVLLAFIVRFTIKPIYGPGVDGDYYQ